MPSPRPKMVPLRTHFSTLLSEIKTLNDKLDSLTQSLPTIIQSQLHHFNDRRCLTIYGLPEDSSTKKKVNAVFNLVSVSPSNISILHRLGKPRQDGLPRPLKVSIKDGIPFPRLIDLSTAMKSDASMSTFHVRKFETPEQRKAGFLARQSKRDAARAEVTDQTTTPTPSADPILPIEMELVEQTRNVVSNLVSAFPSPNSISPRSTHFDDQPAIQSPVPVEVTQISDDPSPMCDTPSIIDPPSFHDALDDASLKCVNDNVDILYNMQLSGVSMRERYSCFHGCYQLTPHLAPIVSDVYFDRYGFRFNINQSWVPLPSLSSN